MLHRVGVEADVLKFSVCVTARFRRAQVTKVEPLLAQDSAKLLADLMPRKLRYKELGVKNGSSYADILQALENHAVMAQAGGHPGTLVHIFMCRVFFSLSIC